MLFNSLRFLLLFLPIVLVVAYSLRGRAVLVWLCIASAVFYAFAGHAWFLAPMAVTTVLDFFVARSIFAAERGRRGLLVLSLTANLGLLAYFKYSGMLTATVDALGQSLGLQLSPTFVSSLHVLLPAGISFYTFQTMSYVIDVYRGHAAPERSFFAYLAFVSFFPHLVAGPLTRHNQLLPQLHAIERLGCRARWWPGIAMFSVGLSKKVLVADRIASLIDPQIGTMATAGGVTAWLCMLGYTAQIYYDFSGYSDMAIGLGRLFGIELPQNFDSPYISAGPAEFWRRWHMTLSQWLRDYLYISLGGNRRGSVRTYVNLMLTMVLGGLWHGASWTFAGWGAYHGGLLVLERRGGTGWVSLPHPLRRAVTFVLVCLGWVLFRSTTFHLAMQWFAALFFMHGVGGIGEHGMRLAALIALALGIALTSKNSMQIDFDTMRPSGRAALGLATATAVIMMNYSSKFLYFQF